MSKKTDKKQRRRSAVLPPDARPVICPPDRAGRSLGVRIGGMACRMLAIFFAVLGLALFVCDALRLEQQEIVISTGFLALVSLGFVAVYSAMALSGIGRICGGVLLAGGAAAMVLMSGNVAQLMPRIALTAKNVVLTRLFNIGYYGMSRYISEVSYPAGLGQEYYFKLAVVLLIAVVALVFTLSCIKRVHIVGPVVVSALIIGAVFTYNISRTNWGVVLIIASFIGLIAMYTYDRIFTDRPDPERFDCETVLFPPEERPTLPEGELTPEAARQARRQARRRERENARRHKKEGTQQTVAEELDSYFATSVKAGRREDGGSGLTPQQRSEQRAKQRERRRQVRAVMKYDRAVITSRRAQGGFAAVGAFVLAMILLLMPALTVTGSFNTIEAIDQKMEYYREYVTALLMGNDPILDELGYQNDSNNFMPRSTLATPRYYTGKRLMTVESQYATNVYLRGWIGTSYSDGSWSAVDDDALEAYRSYFGTTLDADELLFHYFYSIMDPSVVEPKDYTSSSLSKLKYGFVGMQVNIKRDETEDSLVYMPALYRVDDDLRTHRANSHGVYAYGTSEVMEDTTFVNYFDGIYTGRKFMSELAYASVAYTALMRNGEWYKNVAALIAEYNEGYEAAYDYIGKYVKRLTKGQRVSFDETLANIFTEDSPNFVSAEVGSEVNTVDIVMDHTRGRVRYTYSAATGELLNYEILKLTEFTTVDPDTGEVSTYTLAFSPPGVDLCTRFRYLMTDEQKRALAYSYYWDYIYESFVYNTYLTEGDDISDTVRAMLDTVVKAYDAKSAEYNGYALLDKAALRRSSDAEVYEARHRLVMAIVNYLKENYTYTLTPTLPTDAALDGVDNFLAVTKEGYCTQFASSLALMLRAAGIPARYVEGYVACDFGRNYSSEAVARYVTTVRDYNAHSWVEVWYDGVGWIQYEATSVYYDDMYVTASGSSSSSRPWYKNDNGDELSPEEQAMEDASASLSLSEALIESMRDELGLLIGSGDIRSSLDALERQVSDDRAALERCRDDYSRLSAEAGWDSSDFLERVAVIAADIDENIMPQLLLIGDRIELLAGINAAVRTVLIVVVLLALAAVAVIMLDRRARAIDRQRMQLLSTVESGTDDAACRRETARGIIDWMTALLAAYGSSPRPGEFREDYARRLEAEYIGIFGRLKHTDKADGEQVVELVSDTDIVRLLEAVAAEEFGSGMTDAELRELAAFCRRLREAAKLRLSRPARIYFHFVKRII